MTRVAIIGGGIGGLTAANALLRAGVEVSVYEAAGELKEIGAGVALHANAMRVLRFIGVEEAVRKVAGKTDYAVTRDGVSGRIISKTSRVRQVELQGIEPATVHRADLLDVLAAALPAGIASLGKKCVSVESGESSATARFADGTTAEADVIIGADGIHSAVRTALFGPDAPRFTGKICYRSVIPTAAVRGGALSDVAADNGQWLGCHYDDDSYRHESWVTECARAEVLERYAGWHQSLLRLFEAGDTWYKWALYDRDPIPAWTSGRVTLLGDAAHPMLPYLGQGACQALEDGAVLANALSDRRFASDPVAALASYELTRRPRASQVVLTARARGVSNHLPSRWAAMRRDAAIAVRRRLNRRDTDGRGAAWLADYDATSPSVLSR
jgi:salicylate hydroxylase